MELIREVNMKSIKDRTFVLALFTVFFLISPGIAGIYLYFPSYIIALDSFKLILLSITMTMPLAVLNAVVVEMCEKRKRERNDDLFKDFVLGTILAGTAIYIAVIVAHLTNMGLRELFGLVLIAEVFVVTSIWVESRRR